MTFEEAFNSGCRFKRPPNSSGLSSWPEGFYWVKLGENQIQVLWSGRLGYEKDIYDLEPSVYKQLNHNDWYLHPEDEHRMKFREKMEEVINGDL